MWSLEVVVFYVVLVAGVSPGFSLIASIESFHFADGCGSSFAGYDVLYSLFFELFGEFCFPVFLPRVELSALIGEYLLRFPIGLNGLFEDAQTVIHSRIFEYLAAGYESAEVVQESDHPLVFSRQLPVRLPEFVRLATLEASLTPRLTRFV